MKEEQLEYEITNVWFKLTDKEKFYALQLVEWLYQDMLKYNIDDYRNAEALISQAIIYGANQELARSKKKGR